MEEPKRDAAAIIDGERGGPAKGWRTAPGDRPRPHAATKDKPAPATSESRVASLASALRRARTENAEQSGALADLRGAEIARLEILGEALAPVVAQLPADCDLFDVAVSPGERPRLFIDQIGFVEMARDRRTYRFLQDTRHGRITVGESEKLDIIVDAATSYIAHRLIEREKALAVDFASGGAASSVASKVVAEKRAAGGAPMSRAFQIFLFLTEFLCSAAFFGLVGIIGLWLYHRYLAH